MAKVPIENPGAQKAALQAAIDQLDVTADFLSGSAAAQVRQRAILTSALTAANRARNNNPISNPVIVSGSGVTVTQSSTAPSALTRNINPANTIASSPIKYYGGNPVGAGGATVRAQAPGGYTSSRYETVFEGTSAAFYLENSASGKEFRVIIGNRYVGDGSGLPLLFNTDNGLYLQVTMPVRDNYKFAIERHYTAGIQGLLLDPLSQAWATPDPAPTFFMVGDSYTGGTGGAFRTAAWEYALAHLLGLNMMDNGVGGSGYIQPSFPVFGDASRLAQVASQSFDIVGVAGGINEPTGTTDTALMAAATLYWQNVRLRQPNALIIVFGVWSGSTGPSAEIIGRENALATAFNAWADPFSIFVPISTDVKPWLFGQGRVASPGSTGNTSIYIGGLDGTDATHPNAAGHVYLGKRGAQETLARIERKLAQIS